MTAEAIHDFMTKPYGLIADVKMLNFFRDIGQTAAIVITLLVLLSMLVKNFWCRYLCPYGALLGIASLLSPFKIRRDAEACIDCEKCARACPSNLPVDRLVQIRSAECTACMACVAACSAQDITTGFEAPAWACATHTALFIGLRAFETDLKQHVHLENDVLFPRAIKLEAELNSMG
jgi:polyferredoxin